MSRRLTSSLERVALAYGPTPLEYKARLSQAACSSALWIKREDLSGLPLGGNKTRQLEFLLGDALARGAQAIVTTAAAQSNFCRACAAACAQLGIRLGLLLRGQADEPIQGNYLLDVLFGAEIRFIDTNDPYDSRIPVWLQAFHQDFESLGLRTETLHMPGKTGALGAAAMVDLGEEMAEQFKKQGLEPRAVYTAAGSGLTVAGLALAFKALGLATRVVGISVQQTRELMVPLIVERACQAAEMLSLQTTVEPDDFDFIDTFRGPAYGVPSKEGINAMQLAGRSEGLLLDPVYSGKAFAGLLEQENRSASSSNQPVVFIHTGGIPGIFANAAHIKTLMTT